MSDVLGAEYGSYSDQEDDNIRDVEVDLGLVGLGSGSDDGPEDGAAPSNHFDDDNANGEEHGLNHPESNDNNDAIGDDNADDNEPNTPVEPKKKLKQKRVVLDIEKLKGPRGLIALEDAFKDFKWKGRGHEMEDLNAMMHIYEHWAHRLFPQYKFEDCIQQIMYLGRKKEAQTLMKKFRSGMLREETPVELFDDDNDEPMDVDNPDPPEDVFDTLMNTANQPPQLTDHTPPPKEPVFAVPRPVELTAEQRERIERNRRIAQEKRLAKLGKPVPDTDNYGTDTENRMV